MHACAVRPHSRGTLRLAQQPRGRCADHRPQLLKKTTRRLRPENVGGPASWPGHPFATRLHPVSRCAHLPGPTFSAAAEADYIDYVRQRAETVYHPIGTCRMGNDATAVVVTGTRARRGRPAA
ncbi:MAG: GMC oxidoreductase [Lysobacterales bacterium]